MDKLFLEDDDLMKMNLDLRNKLGDANKAIGKAKSWLEKATRGDEGQDWDDVFQARDVLRKFSEVK